ncbi:hypothetical protein Poli38472_014331 [Pythium oligandrum]|uniref:Uncharacterized protein n=1 Tax=Pythium oligandrum TaxID=41045 RepID=A0A8K1C7L6_PYTOL|nr:hypothetical protein Poli38472_014331 [Pythium oligandrum]|eukprot:TMW57728.1 hypothetical protein Poli38472_014331 [Pythium oligandrum]
MEFLVHNISHSDLIVELSWLRDEGTASENAASNGENAASRTNGHQRQVVLEDGSRVPLTVLARPKFSHFQQTSKAIMDRVEELREANAASPPAEQAQDNGGSTSPSKSRAAQLHPSLLGIAPEYAGAQRRVRWKAKCDDTKYPIGFNLHECPIPVTDLHDFRLRGGIDMVELAQKHWKRVCITAVYFPLIALLLPKWQQVLKEFKSDSSKQLVYLISGAGIPRNVEHNMQGNSTEITAKLISNFVHQYYPQVEVRQVHSGSNIFRFDDNVQFMTRELRPRLEAHRETIVDRCGEAWPSHFHVTIAYADGPPARLSALNASLRIFRPSYLHVWQLKTYWHEQKLSMDDVDFHAFENIEASPCVSFTGADSMTQTLVKEMRTFRDQFLQGEGMGEVESFWLRKSRKPVLAVLLIEKEDEFGNKTLVTYRGMNCEVSMPTGSLCAERNAIGSALAQDPNLRRRSLKMIGVLGLNLDGKRSDGVSAFEGIQHIESPNQSSAKEDDDKLASLVESDEATSTHESGSIEVQLSPVLPIKSPPKRVRENSNYTSPRKPKRPRTFSCDSTSIEPVVLLDQLDRNPLAPCGACKEWLVKIAESNPSFRVVTFENARCRNFYINQIM